MLRSKALLEQTHTKGAMELLRFDKGRRVNSFRVNGKSWLKVDEGTAGRVRQPGNEAMDGRRKERGGEEKRREGSGTGGASELERKKAAE